MPVFNYDHIPDNMYQSSILYGLIIILLAIINIIFRCLVQIM